jgi:hypothetical protein
MRFFRKLLGPKVITARQRIPGEQVAVMLRTALASRLAPNYRHIGTKRVMAVTERSLVQWASNDSYETWIRDAWECENQGDAAVQALQLLGRREGCSHACGVLYGIPANPDDLELPVDAHVWMWAIVSDSAYGHRVVLFDTTSRDWADLDDVRDIYFSRC